METKEIEKLFQYFRVRVIQKKKKSGNISYSHVSIAGESHLRKIVPKLISVGAIRFATEILYHAKRSYFLAPLLHGIAHVLFPPKGRKMRRCFYADPALPRSLPLASGRNVKRARESMNSRGTLRKTRAAVFYLATANFIFASGMTGVRGMREQAGRDYRGFLEVLGVAAAAMAVAAVVAAVVAVEALLDGYTPDILPDNGRSGSH